jgi:uncharacterized protein (TIGR03083 family)
VTLGRDEYLELLRHDASAMAIAAAKNLDANVPSCPGWTIADLLAHTSSVHRGKAAAVANSLIEKDDFAKAQTIDIPPREELVGWFQDGVEELISVLATSNPSSPVWNWSATEAHTAAFWPRRMAHETAIHRWDAEAAVGTPEPIESELATDGVDEFLFVFVPTETSSFEAIGKTLHLHRTDGAGEWFIRVESSGVRVIREHAKGDVALRGTASNIDLLLWRRIASIGVETFGDRDLLARFLRWVDLS